MNFSWKLPKDDTYFAKILEQTPLGFELDHLDFALYHVKNFGTAIDGGAHIGTWTLTMARKFKFVIAFEPDDENYECLQENTWDCMNVFRLHSALGAARGVCSVVKDPTRVGNSGSHMIVPGFGTYMNALDDFKFDVDFLKLDVEGFEIEALKGSVDTIKRCKPVVMVECKQFNPPRHGGPPVVVDFFNSIGYQEAGGVRNDRVFLPKG